MAGGPLLVMGARLRVMAGDDQLLALAAAIRPRAATVEEHRMEAVDRTAAVVGHMVAADRTVDMGGRIALDFSPA